MDTLLNVVDSFKTNSQNWYGGYTTQPMSNGDFIVGGVYSDGMQGNYVWQKKYLRKFDKDLNIIWTKYFGRRSFNTDISKLMISNDGNIVGCGIDGLVSDTVGMHITGCIFKFTLNGDSVWMRNYQALDDPLYGDENILMDIGAMPDGGFVASGKSFATLPTRKRGWVLRVDSNGCLTSDCISNTKELENYTEIIAYPNPSNDIINITNVSLIKNYELFNYNGNIIKRGNSFPINIENYSNGFYFLKVITKDNQIIMQKIIKL